MNHCILGWIMAQTSNDSDWRQQMVWVFFVCAVQQVLLIVAFRQHILVYQLETDNF